MTTPRIPLEFLRIDNPCPADWNTMAGDDRRRFCQGCKKHVHDLSAMPREEAERLVCASAGGLCVRIGYEANGTVVTMEYQHSTRTRPRRGWRFWTGVGLAGALFTGVVQAVTGKSPLPQSLSGSVPAPPPQRTYIAGFMLPPTAPTTVPPAAPVSQQNATAPDVAPGK
jgi:hypothetical protein